MALPALKMRQIISKRNSAKSKRNIFTLTIRQKYKKNRHKVIHTNKSLCANDYDNAFKKNMIKHYIRPPFI